MGNIHLGNTGERIPTRPQGMTMHSPCINCTRKCHQFSGVGWTGKVEKTGLLIKWKVGDIDVTQEV